MIDINKKYRTRGGYDVRILCADSKINGYPVVALVDLDGDDMLNVYTEDGHYYDDGSENNLDLVEVSPWDDFKVNDKVLVRDSEHRTWMRRYFSHVDERGLPCTFQGGMTSWSSGGDGTISWNYCKKAEELNDD